MAVTIDAPPDQVWPWLVQMGGDRGGWNSWDGLDNGGRPSATEVKRARERLSAEMKARRGHRWTSEENFQAARA